MKFTEVIEVYEMQTHTRYQGNQSKTDGVTAIFCDCTSIPEAVVLMSQNFAQTPGLSVQQQNLLYCLCFPVDLWTQVSN